MGLVDSLIGAEKAGSAKSIFELGGDTADPEYLKKMTNMAVQFDRDAGWLGRDWYSGSQF